MQPTALDSGWAIDATVDHSRSQTAGVSRFLAEGRDASATVDSALLDADTPGFTNDGDNEITGIHVSDGDPTVGGILGAKDPRPWAPDDHGRRGRGDDDRGDDDRGDDDRGHDDRGDDDRGDDDRRAPWRVFFTQQHGDNNTWELVPRP